jgi:hypothetical protein
MHIHMQELKKKPLATESKDHVIQIHHPKHPLVELQNAYVSNTNTGKQINALLRSRTYAIHK